MLESARELLDFFLFLLKVDIHLLCLCTESCILVTSDIELDLQVAVHASDLFPVSRSEKRRLICLDHVLLLLLVDGTALTLHLLSHRQVSSTAEEYIA